MLGGQKVRVDKPRVLRQGREVPLASYAQMQATDPLGARALEHMVIGVSTRNYGRSLQPVAPVLETRATSKSAVSRRFTAKTRIQLEAVLSVPLGGIAWAALLIDGIAFADHVVIIVMGIDATGRKHIFGMREGSTENAAVCRELLADLIARGLAADRSLLIVMDGGKGLRKAVGQVFGAYAVVQTCQVRNVSLRVKTWRSGTMILHWVATGVFEASKGFRRLNGHTGMPTPIGALKRRDVAIPSDNVKQVG